MDMVITGAAGLLGSALVREALRRGHHVLALFHHRPPVVPPAVETRAVDLTDPTAVHRLLMDTWPAAVLHAAAASRPTEVANDPAGAARLNVDVPGQLAALARHLGARLVHASTDQVFGGDRAPYRVNDPLDPRSDYARQKVAAEQAVRAAAPTEATILRLPLLLGHSPAGDRSVHEVLWHEIQQGRVPTLFTDEIRQPVDADSAAAAMVELAERPPIAPILHWPGPEAVTRYELGRRLLAHLRLPPESIRAGQRTDHPATANRPADLRLDAAPLTGRLRTRVRPLDGLIAGLHRPRER